VIDSQHFEPLAHFLFGHAGIPLVGGRLIGGSDCWAQVPRDSPI